LPANVCRYGLSYVLHRLPAVATIMLTPEYLEFAQQVMSSHDKANQQAELDVSATMGEMLQDMQACLKQLCGSSAIPDPEAVARLIAEKVTAMNMSSDIVPRESGKAPALPAPVVKQKVILPDMPADAKRHKASLIQAPSLYDTSGSINTVALAWKEWSLALHRGPSLRGCLRSRLTSTCHWASVTATSTRKTDIYLSSLSLSLAMDQAVSLMTHIAEHFQLSLDQVGEGSRLLAGKTAKTDGDTLTAESPVTLGDFKTAVGWAYSAIAQRRK